MIKNLRNVIQAVCIILLCISIAGCSLNKNAKYYYKEGMEYFNDSDYVKAEKNLKIAVSKNKNRAEYVLGYAFALIKTGKTDTAVKQFNKVIKDKDNKIVRENNKKAYRGLGIAYYEASDYKEAYNMFDKALAISELDDLDIDIRYYLGKCQEKLGLYKEAVNTYTILIKEDKKDSTNFCQRAYSYVKLNKYDKALEDYNAAMELEDKNYDIYFLKYFFLLNTEGSDKAKEVLNSALKIDTKETDYYNVGKIYYYMGDFEKAETNLNKALKEEDHGANYFLGEIAYENKEYEKAINYYKAYIEKNPVTKSGAVYNQLGVSYLETGDYKNALNAFTEGINLEDVETMKTLKFNEIVAYEKLIEFDKALTKIEEYLEQYPNDDKAKKELEFIKTRVQ